MPFSLFALLLAACGTPDTSDTVDSTPPDAIAGDAVGRCLYTNPFSASDECKEYLGDGWSESDAAADCEAPVIGADPGAFEPGLACDREAFIGECVVDAGGEGEVVTVFPGDDPGACSGAEFGCGFTGGEFVPAEVCLGGVEGGGVDPEDAFVPFEQVCMDPLEGEPDGQSADGQVCTWQAISGATEAGRRFVDYASCDTVLTQRPYYPYSVTADTAPDDPRLSDGAWRAEYEWVTEQVEATACVCCHTTAYAPDGPSGWYLEAEPIWTDTLGDSALAMMAGWVDSTAFGAFPAEQNNGFDRSITGQPTTDPARMLAFLEGELARRGLSEADFADTPPFGGLLYDQLFYEPDACEDGQGVSADGEIRWTGGDARYVYVLAADSDSPGVPPNLDLPDGTIWRLDVDHTAAPVASGLTYGAAPDGARQAWPESGGAPALIPGETYYLYVLLDIYQPATRCLFVAE